MNLVSEPVHCPCKYLKSDTSFSVVLFAKDEVEGLGGNVESASPYAGPSCSLTSVDNKPAVRLFSSLVYTVYRFALC